MRKLVIDQDMRTKREIYDIVRAHLLAQNAKATSASRSRCLYLDPATGRKCAVGCLIPSSCYSQDIEGDSFYGHPRKDSGTGADTSKFEANERVGAWRDIYAAVPELLAYAPMLYRLQILHDDHDPREWPAMLDKIGLDEFGLDNQDVSG